MTLPPAVAGLFIEPDRTCLWSLSVTESSVALSPQEIQGLLWIAKFTDKIVLNILRSCLRRPTRRSSKSF